MSEEQEEELSLTYEEIMALKVLRKSLIRKPKIAPALIEGISKEMAVRVLQQAIVELNALQSTVQAFAMAAKTLSAKLDKKENKEND